MTTDLHDALHRARSTAPAGTLDLQSLERRRDRRTGMRRTGGLVVGLALSVGIAGAAMSLSGQGGEERRNVPAAPAGLELGDRSWYRDEILFVSTGVEGDPDRECILRFRGTRWITADWAAETRGGALPMVDGTGAIGDRCHRGSSGYVPVDGQFEDASFGAGEYPHDDPRGDQRIVMEGLPTDPDELIALLIELSAPDGASPVPAVTPGPGQEYETGGWVRVLEDSVFEAPPALQPGFYWFGRQIPGMEADDTAVDPSGRPAVSLHIVTEFGDRTWYFDPASLQVMAYVGKGSETGELGHMQIVIGGGIVQRFGERPRGDEVLVPEPPHDPEVDGVTYPIGVG
jgi:hypothetical protein